jgi:hypothetical protein
MRDTLPFALRTELLAPVFAVASHLALCSVLVALSLKGENVVLSPAYEVLSAQYEATLPCQLAEMGAHGN